MSAPAQISSVDDYMIMILKLAKGCRTEEQARKLEEVAGQVPHNTFEGAPPVGHPRPEWYTGQQPPAARAAEERKITGKGGGGKRGKKGRKKK